MSRKNGKVVRRKAIGNLRPEDLSEAQARFGMWQRSIVDAENARRVEMVMGEAHLTFLQRAIEATVGKGRFHVDLDTGELFENPDPEPADELERLDG